jgi:hypothetical protein
MSQINNNNGIGRTNEVNQAPKKTDIPNSQNLKLATGSGNTGPGVSASVGQAHVEHLGEGYYNPEVLEALAQANKNPNQKGVDNLTSLLGNVATNKWQSVVDLLKMAG